MNLDRLNPSPDDPITDAAAHWCMRLHADDCTLVEREAFSRWLAADPRHAEEYQAMLEIWQTADLLPRTATVIDFNPLHSTCHAHATGGHWPRQQRWPCWHCRWPAGWGGNKAGCPTTINTSKRAAR